MKKLKPIKVGTLEKETFYPKNIIEVNGNNGANYVKFGDYGDSNLIYLEVGHCCVITFRGLVTAEMLSSFLTNSSYRDNKDILSVIKDSMDWDEETNKKFSDGSCNLNFWGEKIKE